METHLKRRSRTSHGESVQSRDIRCYLANHDARAALTCLECGACTERGYRAVSVDNRPDPEPCIDRVGGLCGYTDLSSQWHGGSGLHHPAASKASAANSAAGDRSFHRTMILPS